MKEFDEINTESKFDLTHFWRRKNRGNPSVNSNKFQSKEDLPLVDLKFPPSSNGKLKKKKRRDEMKLIFISQSTCKGYEVIKMIHFRSLVEDLLENFSSSVPDGSLSGSLSDPLRYLFCCSSTSSPSRFLINSKADYSTALHFEPLLWFGSTRWTKCTSIHLYSSSGDHLF